MLAGCQEFNITPETGLLLKGYARPLRPNQGVHDPLMGCCLYLSQGEESVAIVTLDLLQISTELGSRIRQRAAQSACIPYDRIFLCCSHTHSAPRACQVFDGSPQSPEEDAYMESLAEKIVQAVVQAREDAFPASVGMAQAACGAPDGIGGNRDHRGGICDPRAGALGVWDRSGHLRCVLAHYALHPTILHEDNLLVTADYPAYIRREIQEQYPGCSFGFLQGTSGDQSSRYYRKNEGFDEAERFGRTIGSAVIRALKNCPRREEPVFSVGHAEIPMTLRTFPPVSEMKAEIEKKTAEYQRLLREGDPMTAHNAKQKMLGAECKLEYALAWEKDRDFWAGKSTEIWAMRLEDGCMVWLMGECFVEFGLAIRALSGADVTLVVELTNGTLPGYICTPAAYTEGGYEPDATMLSPAFGLSMTQAAVSLARSLFD